jgi:hypothetical protein
MTHLTLATLSASKLLLDLNHLIENFKVNSLILVVFRHSTLMRCFAMRATNLADLSARH